jgi:luciferase family oxidoreductase group 1
MRLSIVELATVSPGATEADALADALRTAQHADALGFHRVWFAEHHLTTSQASHNPELMIAFVGAQTSGIRVGSGSVLLNHYSPFKVAEVFQQLEAMLPGRVDLGLGRATSGPIIDAALRPDRRSEPADDHAQRVTEVLAWLYEAFPETHPFAGHPLVPSVPTVPQTWLLGSSPDGSSLAASLGIGYAFAGFINPASAAQALRNYGASFHPNGLGLDRPRAMLAVNVSVGADPADGDRLVASAKGYYARLARVGPGATVPSADQALRELTPTERDEPTAIVDGRWPRFVAGDTDQVGATLRQMLDESGADELMIQNLIADPSDRRVSHQRLAQLFELRPRGTPSADHRA